VPGFPGITISDDGRVTIDLTGSGVSPVSGAYERAVRACSSLLPKGSALPAHPRPPAPEPPVFGGSTGDAPARPAAPPEPV
jgi:hypothetical protein